MDPVVRVNRPPGGWTPDFGTKILKLPLVPSSQQEASAASASSDVRVRLFSRKLTFSSTSSLPPNRGHLVVNASNLARKSSVSMWPSMMTEERWPRNGVSTKSPPVLVHGESKVPSCLAVLEAATRRAHVAYAAQQTSDPRPKTADPTLPYSPEPAPKPKPKARNRPPPPKTHKQK